MRSFIKPNAVIASPRSSAGSLMADTPGRAFIGSGTCEAFSIIIANAFALTGGAAAAAGFAADSSSGPSSSSALSSSDVPDSSSLPSSAPR